MKKRNIFSNFRTILISILVLTSLFGSIVFFGQAADPNLVLYLPLDEGSGNSANDDSGNGNNAVVTGASWITGVSGTALEFDGIDDIVIINNTDILNSVNAVTISCWVKIKESTSLIYFVMASGIGIFQAGNETGFAVHLPSTNSARSPLMLDVWKQITGTFDGTNIKFYVDGALIETKNWPGTMDIDSRLFIIGFFNDDWWDGAIDEVCVWNRVLSAVEVESHYNNTNCASIPLSPIFLALLTLVGAIFIFKKRK